MTPRRPFDPSRARGGAASAEQKGGALFPESNALTPRQVNALVRGAVAQHVPATLHVLGEVGDCSRAGSGHLYFTLKDEESELRCVMWRSDAARLRFAVESGMQVIATGGVEVYLPRGAYQLMVRRLEPRGVGALEVAFRQLRDRLAREGLLARRKRPLPVLPARVAVITSEHGAALRDILQTMARRCPSIEVLLTPVPVQGGAAAPAIAAALERVGAAAEQLGIEVVIVGRGGGSLEDLWAFNEESVARAIAACPVPVVSAVGHEVDVTISDLVADVRAATPTAAAELVAPNRAELLAGLASRMARAGRAVRHGLELGRAALERTAAREWLARPTAALRERAQALDERVREMHEGLRAMAGVRREGVRACEVRLLRFGCGVDFVRQESRLARLVHLVRASLGRRVMRGERALSRRAEALRGLGLDATRARVEERLRQIRARLSGEALAAVRHARQLLDAKLEALAACDPKRVLQRGYSLTRDARTRRVVRSVDQVRDGTRLVTEVTDGEFGSIVEDPRQPRLFR